jgi:hypothetical protein
LSDLELVNPAVAPPRENEWSLMLQQAQQMAASSIVPAEYRKRPENIVTAALMGRELGWGVTTAIRFVSVIEGKPTVSPEGQLALVRRAGHSVIGETSATSATARGRRADTGDEMVSTFTMDDAEQAGLTRKSNWKQYPQSMCWARAVSQLCRMLFSDVLLGAAYVPEEFGAPVNERGEVIDARVLGPVGEGWDDPEQAVAEWDRLVEATKTDEAAKEWVKSQHLTLARFTPVAAEEWAQKLDADALVIDAELVDEDETEESDTEPLGDGAGEAYFERVPATDPRDDPF